MCIGYVRIFFSASLVLEQINMKIASILKIDYERIPRSGGTFMYSSYVGVKDNDIPIPLRAFSSLVQNGCEFFFHFFVKRVCGSSGNLI